MKRLTNAERLKRLYVVGKLTLDEFMAKIDAQLVAGTLDDKPPEPGSPEAAAEKWRTGAASKAANWSQAVEREFGKTRKQ